MDTATQMTSQALAARTSQDRLRGFMVGGTLNQQQVDNRIKDLQELKKWGSNVVRFQLLPTGEGEQFKQNLRSQVAGLRQLLPEMKKLGIQVIVDMHWAPGTVDINSGQDKILTADKGERAALQRTLNESWQETVNTLVQPGHNGEDYKSVIFGYDLLNEPAASDPGKLKKSSEDWRDLAKRLGRTVLAAHPESNLIVESILGEPKYARHFRPFEPGELVRKVSRADRSKLKNAKGNWTDFRNVLYSVHMYGPKEYTFQGVEDNPQGVAFGGQIKKIGEDGKVVTDSDRKPITETLDKDYLKGELETVSKWQERTRQKFRRDFGENWKPRVYVGEFSASRTAAGKDQYVSTLVDIFEENGWDWTYHAFRESHVWNPELPAEVYKGDGRGGRVLVTDPAESNAILNGVVDRLRENPDSNSQQLEKVFRDKLSKNSPQSILGLSARLTETSEADESDTLLLEKDELIISENDIAFDEVSSLSFEPDTVTALDTNLLFNPGAEASRGALNFRVTPPPLGWDTTSDLSAVSYEAAANEPTLNPEDSLAVNGGDNYFAGGGQKESTAFQTVSFLGLEDQIDASKIFADLSGFFGGYENHGDNMTLSAKFYDGKGTVLGEVSVGGVKNEARDNETKLVFQERRMQIPQGARSAEIRLTALREAGAYNDGYADNLSFTLSSTDSPRPPVMPQPTNFVVGTSERDVLLGTPADDIIIGGGKVDRLTGGGGKDQFVYQSMSDRRDRITDFEVGQDTIVLTDLFASRGLSVDSYAEAMDQGYLEIISLGSGNSRVRVDVDGSEGRRRSRVIATLENVSAVELNSSDNFVL